MPSRAALIASLVLSIIMVIFALANTDTVQINFLVFQTPPYPVALLLIVTFTMGVLVGVLGSYASRKKAIKRKTGKSTAMPPSPPDPPSARRGSNGPDGGMSPPAGSKPPRNPSGDRGDD